MTESNQPQHDNRDDELMENKLETMSEEQFQRKMQQAAAMLVAGNARDAIPLLEQCYDLHPDDVNVLTNLGGAYILAEKHRWAVPVLERASELAPNNPNVWSNLAAAYLGKLVTATRVKQNDALTAYARVLEIDTAYPNVHYNMGLIYVDRRDWDAAHAAFSRALDVNPHDKDAKAMRRQVEDVRNHPPDSAEDQG